MVKIMGYVGLRLLPSYEILDKLFTNLMWLNYLYCKMG